MAETPQRMSLTELYEMVMHGSHPWFGKRFETLNHTLTLFLNLINVYKSYDDAFCADTLDFG
jgi:hypothetical protein